MQHLPCLENGESVVYKRGIPIRERLIPIS